MAPFVDATEAAGLGHLGKSHGVTFADYDRDGDLDLYAPVGGAQPGDQWPNAFYRSEGFGNHYLVLELEGVESNRDGIGAKVWVYAGDLMQLPRSGFWIQLRQQQQLGVGIWFGATGAGRPH